MRDWLNSVLGQDGGRVAQFALALIAVVLLILLLAWIVRRLQPGSKLIAAAGGKGRKRLGVLEASDVDTRRRLVLVRRDDVEHLIMIGGPNDLLIESRILRGGHVGNRPNIQHMPRPGTPEADRLNAPATGAAPTGSSLPAAFPTPQAIPSSLPEPMVGPMPAAPAPIAPQQRPAPVEEPELSLEEFDFEASVTAAPPPAKPQFAPPPFTPQVTRPPMTPAMPTPAAGPDTRRPSLGDLLSAATAAKAANPRDMPQPLTAPPPMPRMAPPAPQSPAQPDLEEDDREMPTQIVARRPAPPSLQPQPRPQPVFDPAPAAAAMDDTASRETEVTSQIERALADLNPAAAVIEAPQRIEPVIPPRRPQLEPVQAAPVTRPMPAAPAPTMPPIPLRPTPPARPIVSERPPLVDRPPLVERPPLPERAESPRPSFQLEARADDRAPTGEPSRPFAPVVAPEPVTSPRPITAPIPRMPVAAAPEPVVPAPAPVPVPAPTPSIQQKTDELEEEMAKLLSELGGSSSR